MSDRSEMCLSHSGFEARLKEVESEVHDIRSALSKVFIGILIAIVLSAGATLIAGQVRLSRLETLITQQGHGAIITGQARVDK